MLLPIIDTTRSYMVAVNPFGDEPEVAGFYVACFDPLDGPEILPLPGRETREEAEADLAHFLATFH